MADSSTPATLANTSKYKAFDPNLDSLASFDPELQATPMYRRCNEKKLLIIHHPKINHLFSAIDTLYKHHYPLKYYGSDGDSNEIGVSFSPNDLIQCVECPPGTQGFFASLDSQTDSPNNSSNNCLQKHAIVGLCANNIDKYPLESHVNAVTHELVHVYDRIRIHFDEDNCAHHLCTEIRAAALSGECSLAAKYPNGSGSLLSSQELSNQFAQCVKETAFRNTMRLTRCHTRISEVEQYMINNFDQCIRDTVPFGIYPE